MDRFPAVKLSSIAPISLWPWQWYSAFLGLHFIICKRRGEAFELWQVGAGSIFQWRQQQRLLPACSSAPWLWHRPMRRLIPHLSLNLAGTVNNNIQHTEWMWWSDFRWLSKQGDKARHHIPVTPCYEEVWSTQEEKDWGPSALGPAEFQHSLGRQESKAFLSP